MVVEQHDGRRAAGDGFAEDLARMHDRRVERSGGHELDRISAVLGVEQDDTELLDGRDPCCGSRYDASCARRVQPRPIAVRAHQRPASELHRRQHLCRARAADTGNARRSAAAHA